MLNWPAIGAPTAAYSPETTWAFGVSAAGYIVMPDDNMRRASELNIDGAYTLRRQWFINLSGTLYLTDRLQLSFRAGYRFYPDRFYGIGNSSPSLLSPPQQYDASLFRLYAQPLYRLTDAWHIGGGADIRYEGRGITPGKSWLLTAAGAAAMYDTRENIYYPHCGLFFKAQTYFYGASIFARGSSSLGRYAEGGTGEGTVFVPMAHIVLDLRHFVPLYKELIFAYQVYADMLIGTHTWQTTGASGEAAYSPISVLMPTLGGTDLLRGFYHGLFRDESAFALQGELRFPIYHILRGTVFAAVGDTYSLHQPQWTMPKVGYGIGLRLQFNTAGINIRADIARNNYMNRWDDINAYSFYLTVKEAF